MGSEDFRRGGLVGDAICGNFATKGTQDKCCSDLHENDVIPSFYAPGDWQYVPGMKQCQYIFIGALPGCTEDAKICPNGRVVSRDPEDGCRFKPC